MNVLIVCSSYPATPTDASVAAGLFVRDLALAIQSRQHRVIVQPVGRKRNYLPDPGLIIEPLPWWGGDKELASLSLLNPWTWLASVHLFWAGRSKTFETIDKHAIDHVLAIWVIPSGIFGYFSRQSKNVPFDVWALGSDIWKIRKIPFFGPMLLRAVIRNARHVYADGYELSRDVQEISGRTCEFLASSRILPPPRPCLPPLEPNSRTNLLFVGRYHRNKAPDLLLRAIAQLHAGLREKIYLRIFGLGPLDRELTRLWEELGLLDCVQIGASIESQDYADQLSLADFLVIPSRIDSIPLVFSDALQAKIPVITMPIGDLVEIVVKYRCGEVATEATVNSLAQAIERAITTGPSTYRAGCEAALKIFDVHRSAERWLERTSE